MNKIYVVMVFASFLLNIWVCISLGNWPAATAWVFAGLWAAIGYKEGWGT